MAIIGLDIGGANLKAATADGAAQSRPFALWKRPRELAAELNKLLADWPTIDRFAVTMTGELCDCFTNRADGVRHILRAVKESAGRLPVHVWRNDGRFSSLDEALADPLPAASANWLALATFAGRFANSEPAILIDVGSTTTDIVLLVDGRPALIGRTDDARLASGELVYTGSRRTPICALLEPGEGMAEVFATTLDVGLVLGSVPDDESDCDTADGQPATRVNAETRLARMLGCDSLPPESIHRFAERLAQRQIEITLRALAKLALRLPSEPKRLLVSGSGAHLALAVAREYARRAGIAPEKIDLNKQLGPTASAAACAVAAATLLSELA